MRAAFTLVELMIVVAIIAILAAIAIPAVHQMQLKAKVAELEPNVAGISDASLAYEAAFGEFLDASVSPASAPSKSARPWTGGASWDALGWAPDGDVRGSYDIDLPGGDRCAWDNGMVALSVICGMGPEDGFCAFGQINVDADLYGRCHTVFQLDGTKAAEHHPATSWQNRF